MKDGYIYQADVYCDKCGRTIREELRQKGIVPPSSIYEGGWDSDDFPVGPLPISESDYPQHCGRCHIFLENELTSDGYVYVRDALLDWVCLGLGNVAVLQEWFRFYKDGLLQHCYSCG